MSIHLFDPDIYIDGPPHEELERLRRDEPVSWQPLHDERDGCWTVLRHADLVHVAREAKIFSAEEGGVVVEDLAPEQLAMMRNMLLAMDPPRHQDYRRPLAPSFSR
jgi:cytochrome P450